MIGRFGKSAVVAAFERHADRIFHFRPGADGAVVVERHVEEVPYDEL